MALEMVFNELSLDPLAPNIAVAQQWMQEFIDLVRAAQKLEIKSLRIYSGFNQAQLASNYSIAQWRNDGNVDLELRRFFKSLQTKSPFIDIQTEPELLKQNEQSEFHFQNQVASGLGVAYLLEALAVSFPSAPHWQTDQIYLEYSFLDPDTIKIISQNITVYHASNKQHFTLHHTWIKEQTCLQPWTPNDQIVPSYSTTESEIPVIAQWLQQLSDIQGRNIVINRLTQAKNGNLGDYKDFNNILELRIHYGCGYRIYCTRINNSQIMVLLAGRKSDQHRDIANARKILKEFGSTHCET
jgi:putative addiction module killer protein